MASMSEHTPSSSSTLSAIEGVRKWDGTVYFNFLEPNDPSDIARFGSNSTVIQDGSDFLGIPVLWKLQFINAAYKFSSVANISVSFDEVSDPDYLLGDVKAPLSYGFMNFPSGSDGSAGLAGGFGTSNTAMQTEAELGAGSDRIYTFLHELGHAFGLGHNFDGGNGTQIAEGAPYYAPMTVMTYNISTIDGLTEGTAFGLPVTPMALDIAALQSMYGANSNHNSGDTQYILTDAASADLDIDGGDDLISIGRAYYSIWDGGGQDEISYSGNQRALINLNSATIDGDGSDSVITALNHLRETQTWSTLSEDTRLELSSSNYYKGGFFSSIIDANGDRIAGGFTIARNAVIENASGGSGNDIIIGNEANNILRGNAGADIIFGGAGNDFLFGGVGNDTLRGGSGINVLVGGEGDDDLIVDIEPSGSQVQFLWGGLGNDNFHINSSSDNVRVLMLTSEGLTENHILDFIESRGETAAEYLSWGSLYFSEYDYDNDQYVDAFINFWDYDVVLINAEANDSIFVNGSLISGVSSSRDVNQITSHNNYAHGNNDYPRWVFDPQAGGHTYVGGRSSQENQINSFDLTLEQIIGGAPTNDVGGTALAFLTNKWTETTQTVTNRTITVGEFDATIEEVYATTYDGDHVWTSKNSLVLRTPSNGDDLELRFDGFTQGAGGIQLIQGFNGLDYYSNEYLVPAFSSNGWSDFSVTRPEDNPVHPGIYAIGGRDPQTKFLLGSSHENYQHQILGDYVLSSVATNDQNPEYLFWV